MQASGLVVNNLLLGSTSAPTVPNMSTTDVMGATMSAVTSTSDNIIMGSSNAVHNNGAASLLNGGVTPALASAVPSAAVPTQVSQQVGGIAPTTATPAPGVGPVPQDIATMSDQDLIRYINPNCFDQGGFQY